MRRCKRFTGSVIGRGFAGTFFLVCIFSTAYAAHDIRHIILVQNSGWMLPFYEDSTSKLKPLVNELSSRIYDDGGSDQIICSFNQSFGENKSPKFCYSGRDKQKIKSAIESIMPVIKPGRQAYADTDFREAIVTAIGEYSPGKPCILWIITNNRNSPGNDQETAQRNRDFYEFVNKSKEISRIVAFPYTMKVQSVSRPDYKADGLMIYAMAYGEDAGRALQKMLSNNVPFGERTARLKPLNAEALTFIPKYIRGGEHVQVKNNGRTLYLIFDAKTVPEEVEITGNFVNDFYPYDILSADIAMVFRFSDTTKGIDAKLSRNSITGIVSGQTSPDVSVKVTVPPVPSPWDPEVIFGSGYRSQGLIRFELKNQRLALSRKFSQEMRSLFPNDPLPELFTPDDASRSSVTLQPLVVQVNYPVWPLVVTGILLFIILSGIIGSLILMRRDNVYRVTVNGIQKNYALRPFASLEIKNTEGVTIGKIHRSLFTASIIADKKAEAGNSIRIL